MIESVTAMMLLGLSLKGSVNCRDLRVSCVRVERIERGGGLRFGFSFKQQVMIDIGRLVLRTSVGVETPTPLLHVLNFFTDVPVDTNLHADPFFQPNLTFKGTSEYAPHNSLHGARRKESKKTLEFSNAASFFLRIS